jgi:hypothetical protein
MFRQFLGTPRAPPARPLLRPYPPNTPVSGLGSHEALAQ